MKARIIIGANYGDEGKGTVVANYTKKANNVLNILTNGGSQRGHSILTKDGNITFQHFGAGTYHGADNYYSRFFILNPMQFVKEYEALIVKPKNIYRDRICRWSTPYDSMANVISEELQDRHASCGMGIWNTIKRCDNMAIVLFDEFLTMEHPETYLKSVRSYYEKFLTIPDKWKDIWESPFLITHFIKDCKFMGEHTTPLNKAYDLNNLSYDELIFENGQGLLLSDTGKDTYDTTPSDTGIKYSLNILQDLNIKDVTAHYVTRPYLTRHGDGELMNERSKYKLSNAILVDRTNHYNSFQGEFRYGQLDIKNLAYRILDDCAASGIPFELEVTHCDEMDRTKEFNKAFKDYKVNIYDSPLV